MHKEQCIKAEKHKKCKKDFKAGLDAFFGSISDKIDQHLSGVKEGIMKEYSRFMQLEHIETVQEKLAFS